LSRTATGEKLRVERLDADSIRVLTLSAPKANVLDDGMIAAVTHAFEEAGRARDLRCVVLQGEGAHFSFGASVEEHLPENVERMLPRFHGMFRAILGTSVFCIAAVRGRCLGGGMELASFCHRVVASRDACFGQPEIRLGVFAPLASITLAERIGRPAAEDLCVTGRTIDAEEALALGLVDEIAEDPLDRALEWTRSNLACLSAASLRHAVRALREPVCRRLHEDLAGVERIYLEELMATRDAAEGIRAFLEKRDPKWRNE
jgi:cyclohexa-1,5-dienecarbonyl-CoA hydratase